MNGRVPLRSGSLLRRSPAFWAGLLPIAGLAVALGISSPREGCTYGCSRVEDTTPLFQSCFYREGSACYECYEAGPSGFRTCFENPEGTFVTCTDYQQVPF
jgi:hypothetical protein